MYIPEPLFWVSFQLRGLLILLISVVLLLLMIITPFLSLLLLNCDTVDDIPFLSRHSP